METITIRNDADAIQGTRQCCALCHGIIDKFGIVFTLSNDGSAAVCPRCAKSPENIPARLRAAAAEARIRADKERTLADELEATATKFRFVTEIVPAPDDHRQSFEDTGYGDHENNWPNWMRERIGLPALSDKDRERLSEEWYARQDAKYAEWKAKNKGKRQAGVPF
jgi:hypothetical protein